MARFSRHGIRTWVALALAVTALAACSDTSDPEPADASAGEPAEEVSPAATSTALAGTWERETRCEELVSALTDAGLEQWVLEAVAGNGFVPGVTTPDEIAEPAKPCKGALPRVHAHFFTEDGLFGSLDWNGDQVDDGTYELVGDDTFVVSKEFPDVTFHYVIDDDTITFEPVVPECSPDCFEAAWSVSVAYPGESWVRVG
jgi:hypothetical protein